MTKMTDNATIKVEVDSSGVSSAMLKAISLTKLASRKFLITGAMFLGSLIIVWTKPALLGDGNIQTLFNFWVMLAGVFFGGNIGEHIVNGKKK